MAEETAEETVEAGSRSQMWKHEDAFDWLVSEGHLTEDASGPEIIAAFAARRNEYRRTDRYKALVESHAAEAEEARQRRAEEREAAKAAREAEKAAKAEEKAKAEEAKAAKESGEKPAAKKATSRRRKTTKSDDGDSPFDD